MDSCRTSLGIAYAVVRAFRVSQMSHAGSTPGSYMPPVRELRPILQDKLTSSDLQSSQLHTEIL